MPSGTHAMRFTSRLPVRLLAGLLAAVLALLAHDTACAATRGAPGGRPATAPAGIRAHQPAVTTHHVVSRSTGQATAHTATRHTARSAARTIRLRPGDSLWRLARRYGTTVTALQQANRLGASTQIYAGHRLALPATAGLRARPDVSRPSHPHTRPAASGAAAAVAFARRQLGLPYRWGGTGKGGYDCSGLVQAAWHTAGVSLPRTTTAQAWAGIRITRTQLEPGDLVFTTGYGHVQLYTGHGHVIEAARPGTRVRIAPLPPASLTDAYRRPTDPDRHTRTARTTNHRTTAASGDSVRTAAATIFASQYTCAANIITRESGWKVTATNPASGAYGLAQALPGSKMNRYGTDWPTNPTIQLRWMHAYVHARYHSACNAWAFWQTHHWY